MSHLIDEIIILVTGVYDIMKEEYLTTILHGDMKFSRLIVYAQSIKESKLSRISWNLKRAPNHDGTSAPKVMF